jgi:FkbM family methyltransferase
MSKFTIHHVGARFGNMPFSIPDFFADCIEVVLFDADDDCIEGLIDRTNGRDLRTSLVSACLSDQDGDAEFHITINPSASSLLEPSEASRGFVQPLFGIDWDVARAASVVERRTLVTRRLDTLLSERTEIPLPDFLSLDTQGV